MNWRKTKEILPEDAQVCNIYVDRGWASGIIVCGVPFKKDANGWIDFFASPKHGSIYKTEHVVSWIPTPEMKLDPPDEWIDEWAESATRQ